jgi:hypothetical protein
MGSSVEHVRRDVRDALRGLFSVVNATLLKPMPYERPDEPVQIAHEFTTPGIRTIRQVDLPRAEVRSWRAERDIFAGVEAFRPGGPMEWRSA